MLQPRTIWTPCRSISSPVTDEPSHNVSADRSRLPARSKHESNGSACRSRSRSSASLAVTPASRCTRERERLEPVDATSYRCLHVLRRGKALPYRLVSPLAAESIDCANTSHSRRRCICPRHRRTQRLPPRRVDRQQSIDPSLSLPRRPRPPAHSHSRQVPHTPAFQGD